MMPATDPPLRRGAGVLRFTSRAACPTVAGQARRFRFVIEEAQRQAVSTRRREAVADYVTGWMAASITGEERYGTEVVVFIEVPRPVPIDVARKFVRDCPHYVPGTFAARLG